MKEEEFKKIKDNRLEKDEYENHLITISKMIHHLVSNKVDSLHLEAKVGDNIIRTWIPSNIAKELLHFIENNAVKNIKMLDTEFNDL